MKEELEETLVQNMDRVMQWMERAATFTEEQAPIVVQEILHYEWVSNWLWIGFHALVIAALLFAIYYLGKVRSVGEDDVFGIRAFCVVGIVLQVWIAASWADNLLQICVAPRTFVLSVLGGYFN